MAETPRSDGRTPGRKPRRAVTGRALALGTLVVLLLVLLASPLNRYFASRSALNDAATQLQQDRHKLGQVKQQVAQWGDPGYVQQQARLRLQYAMPGDTVYTVVDHGQQNDIDKTSGTGTGSNDPASWNTKLWGSMSKADSSK